MLAHASHEPLSAVNALIGSIMVPVVSSATVSSIMVSKATGVDGFGGQRSQTQFSTMPIKPVGVAQASSEPVSISSAPIVSALVTWTSQVATKMRTDQPLLITILILREFIYLAPLLGNCLETKSWGNSNDWMLQLHDGRQLVLPLSLYRSLDCVSICSSMEGECVPGTASIANVRAKG